MISIHSLLAVYTTHIRLIITTITFSIRLENGIINAHGNLYNDFHKKKTQPPMGKGYELAHWFFFF